MVTLQVYLTRFFFGAEKFLRFTLHYIKYETVLDLIGLGPVCDGPDRALSDEEKVSNSGLHSK